MVRQSLLISVVLCILDLVIRLTLLYLFDYMVSIYEDYYHW